MIETPPETAGANTHPVAVPALEKSKVSRSETISEKFRMYEAERDPGLVEPADQMSEGAVVSIVTDVVAIAEPGPDVEVATDATDNAGSSMLSDGTSAVQVTVTVKTIWSVVTIDVGEQLDAPLVIVRSDVVKLLTGVSNVMTNSGVRSETADDITPHSALGIEASSVTEEDETNDAGLRLPAPSVTEPALRRVTTVPDAVHETTTTIDRPEAAEGLAEQPVAVPVKLKSPPSRPNAVSLKVAVTLNGARPEEVMLGVRVAVSGAVSITTDDETAMVAGPVLASASGNAFATAFSNTVPSDVHVTLTLYVEPEPEVDGVQPDAVPPTVMSPAPTVTDSLKLRPKVTVRLPEGDEGDVHDATGPVASISTVVETSAVEGPVPAVPVAALGAIRMIAVPSVVQVRVTV